MKEKIEKALDTIRPYLKADGGDVQLVEVADGTVKVRLTGACGGCPMSIMTLRNAVERAIRQEAPEVKTVLSV